MTWLRRPPATLAALALVAAGLGYRIWLLVAHTPPTNSDEATMGLAALHIAEGRAFPVFFYGQAYMGTLEAYLAAPLIWLFGPSTLVLRLPLLALYVAFAAGMFLFTRLVFTPGLAVFVTAFLAFGSDRTIKNQLIALGGYPEISPIAVWLLLLSVGLARGRIAARPWAYAVWGLLVGVLVWDSWLIAPYVLAAAVIVAKVAPRSWRDRAWVAAGFVAGAAPLIAHHLTSPLSENAVSAFLRVSGDHGDVPAAARLYGGTVLGIPLGAGMCDPGACAWWQLLWGPAFLLLLAVAAVLAVRRWRRGVPEQPVRLALLGAAALTLLSYTVSGSAGAAPMESARYLSAVLISLPAVLEPLWAAATGRRRAGALPARAALAGTLALAAAATVALVAFVPGYRRLETERQALVDALLARDADRVFTNYWTCDLIAFASHERIRCAVLADDLGPGHDRVPGYRAAVAGSANPAYVTPVGHPLDTGVAAWLAGTGVPYTVTDVAGYRIYQPAAPQPLPHR